MSLAQCRENWGNHQIVTSDPSIIKVERASYIPIALDQGWGIYNHSGHVIYDSVDFRGSERGTNGQVVEAKINPDHITVEAPDFDYIYVGRINLHYGHFLINTLPRFWALQKLRHHRAKVLCHGHGTPSEWFRFPFFAEICRTLNLQPDDFVVFGTPINLKNVTIPSTSFEEQYQAHQMYRDFCQYIGRHVTDNAAGIRVTDTPAYLSKAKLTIGVGRIKNEIDLLPILSKAGIDIFYPEQMSFADQLRLFCSRSIILGTVGSYFHTNILATTPSRIFGINPTPHVNSNYIMIDSLTQIESSYYYDTEMQTASEDANSGFLAERNFGNPREIAEQYLQIVNSI